MSFGEHAIAHADVLVALRDLPDNSFDALLCDPPYGFRFMGQRWDYDVPSVDVWREALRVLKPGAPLLSFGGARTFHRIAIGIEDAGFELRDCLLWLYGKGFPKSLDVAKAIDKRRDDTSDVRRVCRFLREAMERKGITSKTLAGAFGMTSRMADHWAARDTNSQPTVPTWEQWLRLKDILSLSGELDAEVWRLNDRKGEPGEAWKTAEIVDEREGFDTRTSRPGFTGAAYGGDGARLTYPVKAPASELARLWDGYGTALKPAFEPIILARKPLEGTVAANVARWGTGGLAIDACRVGLERMPKTRSGGTLVSENTAMSGGNYDRIDAGEATGRWPANVTLDEEAAALLDETVGCRRSTLTGRANASISHPHTGTKASSPHLVYGEGLQTPQSRVYADDGGPSRFFYTSKVSTKERDYGCEALPRRSAGEMTLREDDSPGAAHPRAGARGSGGAHNHHPTLKPIALTRWLATLIKPPTKDATLLIPYSGAGSEMIGALQAGWPLVFGIEAEAAYIEIAHARIAAWSKEAA